MGIQNIPREVLEEDMNFAVGYIKGFTDKEGFEFPKVLKKYLII